MKLIYTNQHKNLLNASGKKIRCERQRTWKTIKEVLVGQWGSGEGVGGGIWPFLLIVKIIRMYKCVTPPPKKMCDPKTPRVCYL